MTLTRYPLLVLAAAVLIAAGYNASGYRTASANDPVVLGIHYLELKDGVSPEAVERFAAEEAAPVINQHLPGTRWMVMKGARGARANEYISVYQFDSEEARDALWNEDGSPTERFTEVWDTCNACQDIETRWYEMVEDTGHTDYVKVE